MPYCGHFRYPTPYTIMTIGSNWESRIMQIVISSSQIDIEMQQVYEVKMKLFYTLYVINTSLVLTIQRRVLMVDGLQNGQLELRNHFS
jgi:hypothetical protein